MPSAGGAASPPLAELDGVSKSYGATRALDGVCLQVHAGRVHVLAGENGAGKSTLIRILSGACGDYSGTVRVAGRRVEFRGPSDAVRAGIATIHQELSLVGPMSVADNLLLAHRGWSLAPLSAEQKRAAARQVLQLVDLEVDPERLVETLPLAQQQLVEIGRALAQHARILIMDEPTSALSESEASLLFSRIDRLRSQGAAVVYISHRLEEIYRIADEITVLRDGKLVASARVHALPRSRLVATMVGRELGDRTPQPSQARATVALAVQGLRWGGERSTGLVAGPTSFALRRGEVLGVAGLRGSGSSELLHSLFGSYGPVETDAVQVAGQLHRVRSPRHSIAQGVMLLCSDRRRSVLGELSVVGNASLSRLDRFSRAGWLLRRRERAAVQEVVTRLDLRAPSLDARASQLSGGNQQKVALARCLLAEPRVLLLDEPTRGVDIGAKQDIYALIRELAGRGVAMVLVASELDELIELADRILVLYRGRQAGMLCRAEFSRERILQLAMGPEVRAA